jgi:putative transposase
MPRHARVDLPGLTHHAMIRGLNRQPIFRVPADCRDFLDRIKAAVERVPVEILAWALMPNHAHFLLRSGAQGLAPFMRRLLSGYANAFNKRHRRVGYVFQDRFKSLICDEEEYLLTLVRYIHLNPLKGGLVRTMEALGRYPYCGHGAILGVVPRSWQNTHEILARFSQTPGPARAGYLAFVRDRISEGEPLDKLGGGLLEPLLRAARRARREGEHEPYDSRILGNGDFVQKVWRQAEETETIRMKMKQSAFDLRAAAHRIAERLGLEERVFFEKGRSSRVSEGKAVLIYVGVEYLGKSTKAMAELTRMSVPAASKARGRGGDLIRERRWVGLVDS